MKIGQLLFAFLTLLPGAASITDSLENWQSIELGQADELTIRLRVKRQATLADEEWIAVEFENRGQEQIEIDTAQYYTRSVRHDLQTGEGLSSGSLSSGNKYDLFPNALETTPVSRCVVEPGLYRMIDQPSLYSSALLGLRTENGLLVKAKISLDLRVNNRVFQFKDREFQFEWRYPTPSEFQRMQNRLKHLLANPRDDVQHAYILQTLLDIPEIAEAISAMELLASISPRTHPFSGRESILRHLNDHYSSDPSVIEHFLQRLIDGDKLITHDLCCVYKVWTPDFLPPLMERCEQDWGSIRDVFTILRLQGTPQKTDASLATRLSRALPNWVGPVDIDQPWKVSLLGERLTLVGQTHDRNMISKLTTYLDDKRTWLDPKSPTAGITFNFRIPPLRVCDYALEAILTILDGSYDAAYNDAGFDTWKTDTSDIDEITTTRDKMIMTLKQRLAK